MGQQPVLSVPREGAQAACYCAACLATRAATIYHNPNCGTSRNVLQALRDAGLEPQVIEYLQTPPDRATLANLLARMDMTPRQLLREKGTPYEVLGLSATHWTDEQLIDQMLANPILINRPIVVMPHAVKLCRPSQSVETLLDETQIATLRDRVSRRARESALPGSGDGDSAG